MTELTFPFRFHRAFRPLAAVFGVRPDTASVRIDDDELAVHFGPWHLRTELSEVIAAKLTGPYAWPKVIGPPHLSLADRGVTFATNPDQGVCIALGLPARGIDPWGLVRHPALTVTVEDGPALAELLQSAVRDRIPGAGDADPSVEDLVSDTHDELLALSAAELRRRARELGVRGVSRRSKAELVELLGADLAAELSPGRAGTTP